MNTLTVGERNIALDKDGYLVELSDWLTIRICRTG